MRRKRGQSFSFEPMSSPGRGGVSFHRAILTAKRTLPIVVFIVLCASTAAVAIPLGQRGVMFGGVGVSLVIALLFYAVIRWDEAFVHKEREKQQLANLVDHALDAIMIFDAGGGILYVNPKARQTYGLPGPGVPSGTVRVIGLADERRAAVFAQVLAGEHWHGELEHAGAGGERRIHLVSMFRLEQYQGHVPAVACIGRDLTRPRDLERKLAHTRKLAAVGELAAGVAHEINNPLASILSQMGLAKDLLLLVPAPADRDPQVLACLADAARQVQRCGRIVDGLLRFSRRQEPAVGRVDVTAAVEQAVELLASLPKMNSVRVRHEVEPLLPRVKSDAGAIGQIVANLVINAADAMGGQGEVVVATRRRGAGIAIDVLDRGCGIAPEVIERVFEPFFTTKGAGEGTGLGLSISYGLAQSLGAELSLTPRLGGGTKATLLLPCSAAGGRVVETAGLAG